MRRIYTAAACISALLAVLCVPTQALRFGTLMFGVLAVCTGGMAICSIARAHTQGRTQHVFVWIVRVGNILAAIWLCSFLIIEGVIWSGEHTDSDALTADCLFVLGAGIEGNQPGSSLRARLATTLDLMDQNPTVQVILCGGQGDNEQYTEASVMYRWLTEHGADPQRLTMENQSRTTIENIQNAISICEQNGWDTTNVAAVSNEFHLYRVRHIMQRAGLRPCAAAAPSETVFMRALYRFREYFSFVKAFLTQTW